MVDKALLDRILETSINPITLLSTDYFNHFNGVIMVLSMLPDQPDLMPEIESWSFKTYDGHFDESALGIAALAKEAYRHCADDIRCSFEDVIIEMKATMEDVQQTLPRLHQQSDPRFKDVAETASELLQGYVVKGSSIVNRTDGALSQSAIDELF